MAPTKEATATKKTASKAARGSAAARRESTQLVQQLAVLALAIVLGLIGLALHFLWIPTIVLMAILFGLLASGLRGQRGEGVIAQVATTVMDEAKSVVDVVSEHGAKEPEPKGSS